MTGDAGEVRRLRAQIRVWRRGRVDTSLAEAIGDAYVAVFSAVVLGSMAISVVVNLRVVSAGACRSASCLDARDALGWIFGLGGVAAVLGVARLLGPMLAPPAVGTWLLAAPLDRTALLRARLLVTLLLAGVVSAGVAVTGATLSGYSLVVLGWVTALAGTAGVLLVALSVHAQAHRNPPVRVLSMLLGVVLWLGLVLVAIDAVPDWVGAPAVGPLRVAAVVAGGFGVASVVLAARSLAGIRRERLVAGGALLPGLAGALSSLDLTLLHDILLARRWRARSTVRPVRGRGRGASALVWREFVRLRRNGRVLVVLAAALVLPYLAAALGLGHTMVVAVTLTGFVAGVGLFTSLRVLSRTTSLLRCFPLPAASVRAACLGVPASVLVVWGLATAPAVHAAVGGPWARSVVVGLACGATCSVAAVRWMTSHPPDYRLPLITSPMGAVPTSLYGSVLRGFDVLLLGTAPLLISPTGAGALWSLALDAAVLSFLIGRR